MKRPDLAAWIVTGLALVGVVACSLCHVPIPDTLTNLATASLGAAAGVSFAGGSSVGDALSALLAKLEGKSSSSSTPAAAPAPLTAEPTTGIIPRVASHAP